MSSRRGASGLDTLASVVYIITTGYVRLILLCVPAKKPTKNPPEKSLKIGLSLPSQTMLKCRKKEVFHYENYS